MLVAFAAVVAYAYSNNPGITTGKTPKTTTVDGNSCGQCHSGAHDTSISVTISGPNQLYAGDYGDYQVIVAKSTTVATRIGVDVAASDTVSALTVTGGEPTTTTLYPAMGGVAEMTHVSGGTLSNLFHLVSD